MRVLLRSLWQTVNIGDVAHAPGTLRAFQTYAPDVELMLWVRSIGDRERAMLQRFLPEVSIVEGQLDETGPSTPELAAAIDDADLLLHGPASGMGAERDLAWWRRNVDKPYGVFGVSVDPVSQPVAGRLPSLAELIADLPGDHLAPERRSVLDDAAFVFCRDSLSLEYLRSQGIKPPVLEFGPDATYAYDVHDDAAAERVLAQQRLRAGEFVCVIPRLRYTPYYKIRSTEPTELDLAKDGRNEEHREVEMAHLRELITTVVGESGLRVLLCPEMIYEVELSQTELLDRLPDDVRHAVSWLPYYWSLEEAAAVYARAHSVVSMECHSPIMAVVTGTPTIYLRQPTDTIKGQMWHDLELSECLVEIDQLAPRELDTAWQKIRLDRAGAVERVGHGHRVAQDHLRRMVNTAVNAMGG